ncbi:hypothetical protein Q7P36_001099 [Cladosporium allicinum]
MAQVITVVNKSGKIVKSTKTLAGVFNEAKSAYNERKAELKSARLKERDLRDQERKARGQLDALTLDDDVQSRRGSRAGSEDGSKATRRKPVPSRRDRPHGDRSHSDSVVDEGPRRAATTYRPSPLRFDSSGEEIRSEHSPQPGELVRRHTGHPPMTRSLPVSRRASHNDIDMDLAYGDAPPPLPVSKIEDSPELRDKLTGLQRLLEECNCLQHSAGATIENLQKNPEALAAVGLTLAEISTLVTKLSPGALPGLKAAFPAIMALLASPQFAIAAGVAVGVTIIAFGGYKIVKKIQASNRERHDEAMLLVDADGAEQQPASPAESLDELRELSSVERWRRGIADEQARSVGTSVDGEFITPLASRTLIEEGKLTEADFKPKEKDKDRKKREKKEGKEASKAASKAGKSRVAESEAGRSVRSERSHRSERGGGSAVGSSTSRSSRREKVEVKKKEPSGLKLLFSGHSSVRA